MTDKWTTGISIDWDAVSKEIAREVTVRAIECCPACGEPIVLFERTTCRCGQVVVRTVEGVVQ